MDTLHSSPKAKEDIKKVLNKTAGSETARLPAAAVEKLASMVCYSRVGVEWNIKEFSPKKQRYCIGSSSHDSEIGISEPEAEKVHVVAQKVGESWFVMEYGRSNLLYINGIPDYQFIFQSNGYCYVKIGASKLVLVKGDTQFNMNKSVDDSNEFVLSSGAIQAPYSSKSPCLIGSHACCDFKITELLLGDAEDEIKDEPFLAILNTYNNQLFIESLSKKFPVHIKGVAISEATPVCAGSEFSIGDLKFMISQSTTVDQAGDFIDFSAVKHKLFLMLQVLEEEDDAAINIELPEPGKAVTVGRGSEVTYTIEDQSMSKQHVQLIIYEKSVLASDLNSTNGTFVNDEKINKKLMHAGDFLSIGDHIFFLCYNEDGSRL